MPTMLCDDHALAISQQRQAHRHHGECPAQPRTGLSSGARILRPHARGAADQCRGTSGASKGPAGPASATAHLRLYDGWRALHRGTPVIRDDFALAVIEQNTHEQRAMRTLYGQHLRQAGVTPGQAQWEEDACHG